MKQTTIVVPMSGCFISITHATATTIRSGFDSPPKLRVALGRAARSCAAKRTSDSLSSSEGWNCSGPAPSQRVAPFTVTPTPGSMTSAVNANEASSRTGVTPLTTLSPWRDAK